MTGTIDSSRGSRTAAALVPLEPARAPFAAMPRVCPPRSPFLAQLSRQYESREEALQRRDETRDDARKSYSRRPASGQQRHIVWA